MAETTSELADRLLEEARAIEDPDAALALYQRVLALDPNRSATLYNIGLIHKYRGQWRESQEFNRRSLALTPGDEAANWNLAIASTALHDWATARSVWRHLGILNEDGEGPIIDDFGMTPVRLNPDDDGEVVWARRLCPVRARIANVPYPESGYRFGDVVLHDGAPVGTRSSDGREYSVFNALELFEASAWSTYVAEVQISHETDAAALAAALDAADIPNEDWTANVQVLCRQCSEGRAHETHDHDLALEWRDRHLIGIAAKDPAHAHEVIRNWSTANRWLVRIELKLLPPSSH